MLLRTVRPRNLPVRDVTDEEMLERVLGLTLHGTPTRPLHELLLLQRMELLLGRAERAEPEHLSDHGRVLQQRLLPRRERIEARGDDSLDGLGQRELAGGLALGE